MKLLSVVLGVLLAASFGFAIGRAQGVQVMQEVIRNDCEQLSGFAVGKRVYVCERVQKEKK